MGTSTCDLSKRAKLEEDEEEELQMLASLKRQQEEEEGGTCDSGLSASQVGEVSQAHTSICLILLYYICNRLYYTTSFYIK